MTSIRDPDNTVVGLGYGTGADTNRIVTRTDRRGTVTTFSYDAGKKVARASIANGTGQPSIATRLRPVQSYGMTGSGASGAVDTALAYSRLDAPRLDVGDTSIFWENKFSAPYRIMNAQGSQTSLVYDTTWVALVRRVLYPNGRIVRDTFDNRGNVLSVTDSGDCQGGICATTRYVWNRKWDFDSIAIGPAGDSVVVSYDPANGNRVWQRDGRGASSEVDFYYYSSPDSVRGLLSSMRTALQTLQGPRDSVTYNALGNVAAVKTPFGYWTYFRKDNIGRDTLIVSPTLTTDTTGYGRRDSIKYDLADRVIRTRSVGPQLPYHNAITDTDSSTHAESLWVATYYNPEGLPDSVQRWVRPNWNAINTLTTRWLYDPAGRRVRESSPDGASDSTAYDVAGNAIKLMTRRRDTITLTYDVLNRLTQRITPSVTYQPWSPNPYNNTIWYFPMYRPDGSGGLTISNDGTSGLTIPADTARLGYDVMGNIVTADNSAARVRRNYNANGSISGDTLIILPYVGTDTTLHLYKLTYSYDLAGRRISMRHPYSIAPRSIGQVKDLELYGYDAVTGLLDSVTDVFGRGFQYTYDLENRVSQLDRSVSGGTPQVRTTYGYDADGQNNIRTETRPTTGTVLHRDTLFYDARGKVIRAHSNSDTTTLQYTGLGALAWSSSYETETGYASLTPSERHVPDALGNSYESQHYQNPGNTISVTAFAYNAVSGRLDSTWSAQTRDDLRQAFDFMRYDSAGNITRREAWSAATPYNSDLLVQKSASYFDAAGRLRVQDRRACRVNITPAACQDTFLPEYNDRSAFEEYRYDALGRRVLVRTRSEYGCYWNCRNAITRVVWNGDQILYEISSPGATAETSTRLEQDTGQVVKQDSVDYTPWGRIVYTHGLAVDDPLGLWRLNFSNVFPEPTEVLPSTNWKGQYDLGMIAGYQNPSIPPNGADFCRNYPPPSGPVRCFKFDWPAPYMWKTLYSRSRGGVQGPASWMGNLVESGRDNSGQMYRRNRYYDPTTARFTQEDPIGLAGGFNLYGFAAGDPVNFSDPFGLRVCFKGSRFEIKQLSTAIRNASDTDFELDKQDCVINARSRGHKQLDKIRSGFLQMVNSEATFGVRFTSIYVSRQVDPYSVDAFDKYYAMAYARTIKGKCVDESEPWDLNQVMAHELYHHFPVAQGQPMDNDEDKATAQENVWNRYAHRPVRCAY